MSKSMQHCNGNQICVIDVETTGLDPNWHEMIQICILPLDSDFQPRRDVSPFYVNLKADMPEHVDVNAMKINRLKMSDILLNGHDREYAKDLLEAWVKTLKLPVTRWGASKRIIPLGQNYTFDRAFIINWLGIEQYEEWFDHRYRDTMISALYINDRAAMHSETIPFPKVDLTYLASQHKMTRHRSHDALQDCLITAKIYRRMILRGILG